MPNPSSTVPMYLQIADELAARIDSGAITAGSAMPSEKELTAEFSIARGTARRAIQHLRETGRVITRPQLGSFAADRPGTPPRASSARSAMTPVPESNDAGSSPRQTR